MLIEFLKQAKDQMFWVALFCMAVFVISITFISSFACILSGYSEFTCGM